MSGPYPLTFEPILKPKVWGGRRLAGYGKPLPAEGGVGESWEIADLDATSPTGGGGEAARSVIATGPLAGRTIRDAVRRWGRDLLGAKGLVEARALGRMGDPVFPLLVKYLDAAEHLSVQTHPSPAYAQRYPGAALKTESWVVLESEATRLPSGAAVEPSLFVGVRPGLSAERFRERMLAGDVEAVVERHAARAGECWTLPSGIVHALGAGVLVAEVQTPSDTTFRLYDWAAEYGRSQRPTHVAEAMACLDFSRGSAGPRASRASGLGVVSDTSSYTVEAVEPGDGLTLREGACTVVMQLSGEGEIACSDGGFEAVPVAKGTTALVPAVCAAGSRLRGSEGARALLIRLGV